MLEGDPKTVLLDPNYVVLTQSVARKMFGNDVAMGKFVTVSNMLGGEDKILKVAGIMEDIPENSHLQF